LKPFWFHTANRFETGLKRLIQTGLSLVSKMRNSKKY